MSEPSRSVPFERIMLEAYQYHSTAIFAQPPEIHFDVAARRMCFEIKQAVFGRRVGERVAVYPADWWEAAKARWAPKWFLRLWPARYAEVRIEARDMFPSISQPGIAYRAVIALPFDDQRMGR